MGRPRGFDEQAVTAAAVALFASRVYDGVSVDDLVQQLGVHRNSLYKTFGSKRGLYLTALRWYLDHQLPLVVERLAAGHDVVDDPGLDLLLLAAVERAPVDVDVTALVSEAWQALEQALPGSEAEPAALPARNALDALLGARLRRRAAADQP
ncbi:TetR/AcrR family transcriptional regulator [Cryptosporangium sp. NPDC048952]|uniref:TetR/AcrR family transcriptional regulator n=1 Tax=Cryptosporangium sp. NPDC048952 TaxID=3363961 RepID=UPI00372414E7